jgi:four helix bundle protein
MEYACASRMRIDDFRNLVVWQLADELRREILAFTDTGPASRDFKYRDQIRDAIASVCRNTSEGFDRFRPAEFARFLEFARGSLGEVQDCLLDGRDRKYMDGRTPNPGTVNVELLNP